MLYLVDIELFIFLFIEFSLFNDLFVIFVLNIVEIIHKIFLVFVKNEYQSIIFISDFNGFLLNQQIVNIKLKLTNLLTNPDLHNSISRSFKQLNH